MSFRFLLFFVASLICNGCLSDFSVTWDDVMISLGNEFKDDGQMNNIRKDHYRVYEVIDGDTFWVLSDDNKQIKIRLIGVDAPETQNAFKKKKHPFGKVSKAYLSNIILNHEIKLTFDVDSLDQFGRTLAYAYLENGKFVNEDLVRNGYATVMTIQPNVKFEDLFSNAQVRARVSNLGVWQYNLSE